MIIIAAILVLAVVAAIVWVNLQKKKAAQKWPSTPGTIKASSINGTGEDETANVQYSYSVDGKVYQSHRIGFLTTGTPLQLLRRYPSGKAVEVFYDPADPASSVLQR